MVSGISCNNPVKNSIFLNSQGKETVQYSGKTEFGSDVVSFSGGHGNKEKYGSKLKQWIGRGLVIFPLLAAGCGPGVKPLTRAEITQELGPNALNAISDYQAKTDSIIVQNKLYPYHTVDVVLDKESDFNPAKSALDAMPECTAPRSRNVTIDSTTFCTPTMTCDDDGCETSVSCDNDYYYGNVPQSPIIARVDGIQKGDVNVFDTKGTKTIKDALVATVSCYGGEPVPEDSDAEITYRPWTGPGGQIFPAVVNPEKTEK